MTTIAIAANDQDLTITQKPLLASGDKDSVLLHVDFSTEWDGYTKTAVFYQSVNSAYHAVLDSNDECLIPWEVMASEGTMNFGIYGIKDEMRKTSEVISYKITKGAWSEDTKPSDPTPDIYAQLLTECADAKAAAESVVDIANSAVDTANSALEAATVKQVSVTLAADGWSDNQQTATASGVTASNAIIVSPDPDYFIVYGECQIRAVTQATNSVAFKCEDVPAEDVKVNILIEG